VSGNWPRRDGITYFGDPGNWPRRDGITYFGERG
jgi:hypothetical protein